MKLIMSFIVLMISAFSQDVKTSLEEFDRIDLNVPADVNVIISDKYHLEITGDDDELDRLEFEVYNDKLRIEHRDMRSGFFGWFKSRRSNYGRIKITIHTQSIEDLEFAGTGTLEVRGLDEAEFKLSIKGPIDAFIDGNADDLIVKNYGPGDIEFEELKSSEIEIDNYGPGNVELRGKAKRVNVSLFGPGNIEAYDLTTDYLKAKVIGPGDVEMTVNERVSATIMGPGDVKVKGDPRDIDESAFGPGEVVRL